MDQAIKCGHHVTAASARSRTMRTALLDRIQHGPGVSSGDSRIAGIRPAVECGGSTVRRPDVAQPRMRWHVDTPVVRRATTDKHTVRAPRRDGGGSGLQAVHRLDPARAS